jgi:hypothetical protein
MEVMRAVNAQAFVLERAVIPLNKGIKIGATRGADRDGDAQTPPEAHEGRGKITLLGGAHEAGIPVYHDGRGQSMLRHQVRDGAQRGVGGEVGADLRLE